MPVLDDVLYAQYGGITGTFDASFRSIAYAIAEREVSKYIGSPIEPTVITGSYFWPFDASIFLPHSHVRRVIGVWGLYPDDETLYEADFYLTDPLDGGVLIVPGDCGRVTPCSGPVGYPETARIVYEAGLNPGEFAENESYLLALKLVADQVLFTLVDPGRHEGGAGDPGVVAWSDSGHSETRIGLHDTALGASPLMNYAARLLGPLRRIPKMYL